LCSKCGVLSVLAGFAREKRVVDLGGSSIPIPVLIQMCSTTVYAMAVLCGISKSGP
jgi:hypothetical protein